jgi:hypothetical protein
VPAPLVIKHFDVIEQLHLGSRRSCRSEHDSPRHPCAAKQFEMLGTSVRPERGARNDDELTVVNEFYSVGDQVQKDVIGAVPLDPDRQLSGKYRTVRVEPAPNVRRGNSRSSNRPWSRSMK